MDDGSGGRTAFWHAVFQRAGVSSNRLLSPSRSAGPRLPGSSSRTSGIRLARWLLPLERKPLSLGRRTICSSTLCGGTLVFRAMESFAPGLALDGRSLASLDSGSTRDAVAGADAASAYSRRRLRGRLLFVRVTSLGQIHLHRSGEAQSVEAEQSKARGNR